MQTNVVKPSGTERSDLPALARGERVGSSVQERRSVREDAPLQNRFRERAGARRPGIKLDAGRIAVRRHQQRVSREIRLDHKQIRVVSDRNLYRGRGRDERFATGQLPLAIFLFRRRMTGAMLLSGRRRDGMNHNTGQRAMIRRHKPGGDCHQHDGDASKLRCAAGFHRLISPTGRGLVQTSFAVHRRECPRAGPRAAWKAARLVRQDALSYVAGQRAMSANSSRTRRTLQKSCGWASLLVCRA